MNRTDFTRCSWCCGFGKVILPCPFWHHQHNITVKCGRCTGTGFATQAPGAIAGECLPPNHTSLP